MSAPNELSFLPDDYLASKQRRRTNVICASIFAVVVIAIGSAFSFTEKMTRQVEAQHVELDQKFTAAAVRIAQVQQMQEKQKTMAHQAELTASLLERVPRSYLLADITNSLPAGTSLLDLGLESSVRAQPAPTAFEARKIEVVAAGPPKASPPQIKLYDVKVRITGIASNNLQVAQLLSRLNQSKLLTDVNLVISDELVQEDQKLRRFQFEANLNPTAQVESGASLSKTAVVDVSAAK